MLGASLTDAAYETIKTAILNGEIAVSASIDEKALAEGLGMSRTPVREALLRLRTEGLVEVARGRGIRVRALSSLEMRETYEVLTGLETLAAFLITVRKPGRGDLKPLLDAIATMERTSKSGDIELWGRADEAFHRGLLDLCGNNLARQSGLQFRGMIQRAHLVAVRMQSLEYLARSTAEHRILLTTMLRGEAERASRLHFRQRRRGEAALMTIIEKFRLAAL
jgi:DNA-binding GntR family transcriptional regulator